ncbi:Disease resistance protein RPM1 [Morus notabilis]|uniref:Disease resistance protein RPM1 n=1 Tax=Morus notabilis TaxID=981085 RepID=W9QS18_9ROSA|nr:disease resistance RPP13-like protein 4 [Morus notabilis]EXB37274.1 Disease resistance protein RPM1 [Morus notabilis]
MVSMKFELEKFDGSGDFGLWRKKMRAILVQQKIACDNGAVELVCLDSESWETLSDDSQLERLENTIMWNAKNITLLEEWQLVGIEKPKQERVSWLLKDEVSNVQVVAVVGMGGLGKTTLVNQVYRDDEVKQRFQHRAWITVSQSFDLREVLVKIVEQLLRGIAQPIPNETYSKDILSLKQDIICFLGDKKYLIVLDDLWSVDSWDDLKNAFVSFVLQNVVP